MSTIKSSDEHLTLNADGSGNDIKFQSNGSEVASISDAGKITATNFAANADDLEIQSSTGEKMIKCVKDAQVNLYYDNSVKLATSSTGVTVTGGVAIGGTGTANTLNDYEEGTWTVGWTSTSNTFNPSTTTGYYTKVGNLVTISYHAYLSGAPTINASANGFSFTGLPFTSSSGKSSTITWGHKRWMEWPSNTTDVMLDIEAVSTTIQTLARTSIGELYNIRAVTFSRNGSGISFAGHYYTDS